MPSLDRPLSRSTGGKTLPRGTGRGYPRCSHTECGGGAPPHFLGVTEAVLLHASYTGASSKTVMASEFAVTQRR